jgi:FlaA1/EpsC-like NDP-sugar epimerase
MSQNIAIYRQPWFLPLFALVGTILWLQITPQRSSESVSFVKRKETDFSTEQLKFLIAGEIRNQFIDKAKENSLASHEYPPVATLPDSKKLRIVVTGGSGFVGSHLVDRLMMAGHRYLFLFRYFFFILQDVKLSL